MTASSTLPIGQLAALTGETIKAIRYWTDLGLLTTERRSSGYRTYSPEAVEQVRFLRAAQAAGFSLAEIHQILTIRQEGQKPCAHVRARLEEHLGKVRMQMAQLQALEALLQTKVVWAKEHPDPACDSTGCVYLYPSPST